MKRRVLLILLAVLQGGVRIVETLLYHERRPPEDNPWDEQ